MNSWDLHEVKDCKIDKLENNVGILNNKAITEQIRLEIKRCIEKNNTEDISPSILWDTLKAVIQGELIAITSRQKKLRD